MSIASLSRPHGHGSSVRRLAVAATAALALLGAAAAAAPAAAPWSAPGTISSPADYAYPGSLGFDSRGRALTTWSWQVTEGRRRSVGARTATRAPGAAGFDAERTSPIFAGPLLLFGTTRAVALETRIVRGPSAGIGEPGCGTRLSLRSRFGRSTGIFGRPASIAAFTSTGASASDPQLAVNRDGRALAAWVALSPDCRSSSVRFSARRPGAAFGRQATLSTGRGRASKVAVAVGERGDAVVAWQRSGYVEARYRRAGGRWGKVDRIGRAGTLAFMEAAVSPNGRAYLAWEQPASKAPRRSRRLEAAVRTTTARSFGAVQKLEPTKLITKYGLHLEIARPGNGAVLAWTGWDGASWRTRVARTGPRGPFEAPQTVSPPGVGFSPTSLAVRNDGTLALALLRGQGYPTAFATFAPAGGPFGAFEQVSDPNNARSALVAWDPITGRPTMVFSERIGSTEVVRASNRVP